MLPPYSTSMWRRQRVPRDVRQRGRRSYPLATEHVPSKTLVGLNRMCKLKLVADRHTSICTCICAYDDGFEFMNDYKVELKPTNLTLELERKSGQTRP